MALKVAPGGFKQPHLPLVCKANIILDYGHVPNLQDYEIERQVSHIRIPDGAGTKQCKTKDCPRIGVPCLLYDSEPNEPTSLYLRGGLCFTCQRNLNEKRRTQRKRKSDEQQTTSVVGGDLAMPRLSSGVSRVKFNDEIIDLNPDAVVINGPVGGVSRQGPGYQYPEISSDLLRIIGDLSQETLSLMQQSGALGMQQPNGTASSTSVDALYQQAFLSVSKATFLLTQWKASWDENVAARALSEAASSARSAFAPQQNNLPYNIHSPGFAASLGQLKNNGHHVKTESNGNQVEEI